MGLAEARNNKMNSQNFGAEMALAIVGNLVTATYRLTELEVGKYPAHLYILHAQGLKRDTEHCFLCRPPPPRALWPLLVVMGDGVRHTRPGAQKTGFRSCPSILVLTVVTHVALIDALCTS